MRHKRHARLSALTITLAASLWGCTGEDGQDAEPCGVARDEAAGTTTITCPGAAPVVIPDGAGGPEGQPGADGQDGQPGADGAEGQPGADGADAEPCAVARDDEAGATTVTCPGSEPVIVYDGQDGQPGADGVDGQPGADGVDGQPGADGVDGQPGADGVDGQPGADGVDGQPGADGADAEPCVVARDDEAGTTTITCPGSEPITVRDGQDGADGQDGPPGADGADGAGCSVNDNGDGTLTLTCGDGSASTFRVNHLPTISSVTVEPSIPLRGEALSCLVDAADRDNDDINLSYQWRVDGQPSDQIGAQLPAGIVEDGQRWSCAVTPDDGRDAGAEALSAEVSVISPALFWVNALDSVFTAGFDGSQPPTELRPGSFGVTVSRDALFYETGASLWRAGLDGSAPTEIITNQDGAYGLALDEDNGKLYWSNFNRGEVLRADLDGAHVEMILSGVNSPSGLDVDPINGKLYVITYNNTQLIRADLDGGNREVILPNLGGQGVEVVVAPSRSQIYYSLRNDSVFTADLDGANARALISGQGAVQGLDVSTTLGQICWGAPTANMIRCADLDTGDNIVDIAPANNPWHIAILD